MKKLTLRTGLLTLSAFVFAQTVRLFLVVTALSLLTVFACSRDRALPEKPNILWITCEDITTMLGCYGDSNATTPNLDRLAGQSTRYTNAFATAPVCSPSRSCIITGLYATSLGTQHLRSDVEIPDRVKPFPKHLREAGYFTTNSGKEDYNFTDTTIWDITSNDRDVFGSKAHWQMRKDSQPFFSVFNLGITHQSQIFGDDSTYLARLESTGIEVNPVDPDGLVLPPYYPESPEIRKLWARYYTNVSIMDAQAGRILEQLEDDGLADRTVVFFFSDHGTGMPRAKRALYDSGLKIPLIIHVPAGYAERFGIEAGTMEDRMVGFVDFAPAVLEIAGMRIPEIMQGEPFLAGNSADPTNCVFAASDRVDEAYETARSIRTPEFRYIRNFMPHLPLLQPNFYTDQSEIMQELETFRGDPSLTAVQEMLFKESRPPEELYNLETDPHETINLAADPDYKDVLTKLRGQCRQRMIRTFDTGLMPEPDMIALSEGSTPYEIARDPQLFPVATILEACDLFVQEEVPQEEIMKHLTHPNRFVRYWTVTGLRSMEQPGERIAEHVGGLLEDGSPTVRIEAAKYLVENGKPEAVETILQELGSSEGPVVLYAARAFQEVHALLPGIPEKVKERYASLQEETRGTWYGHKLYATWALHEVLRKELFNGRDLDNWYTFLRDRGKNNDPLGVFSVRDGMIRISGEEWGSLTTHDSYGDYRITLEYRWGEKTFEPRVKNARDCGLLLHSVGEDGGSQGIWMHSIECQIIEGGTGDFIVVGDGSDRFSITCETAPHKQGNSYVFMPGGSKVTVHEGRINWYGRDPEWRDELGFRGENDIERPAGEWNVLECVARDGRISVCLNGKLVNRATQVTPERGKIQIQSEGAEIFFRRVELELLET